MSREIKFRAWDGVLDRMCSWEEVRHVFSLIVNDKNYDLMQFTGLRDKNGREIYEGDILRFFFDDEEFHTCPVSWNAEMSAYVLAEYVPEDMWVERCEYEVIGNVHESPELVTP